MPVKQKDQHSVSSQRSAGTSFNSSQGLEMEENENGHDSLLSGRFKTPLPKFSSQRHVEGAKVQSNTSF